MWHKNNPTQKEVANDGYLRINGELYSITTIEQEIEALEEVVVNTKADIRSKEQELILKKTFLREELLKQQFSKFIMRQSESVQKAVYLNKGLLRFVVKSYYDDIYRYKEYSGSILANNHKQAAYTIKWIVRFKPIQIREEYDNELLLNNIIIDINLIFALVCGFSFLSRESINLISEEKKEVDKNTMQKYENEEKPQSFYDKLLYCLRYRPITAKQYIPLFEALDLRCRKNI